ncbi:MAG: transposase [Candidatus Solibacter usitatus]|nr:transposase [Candidatus Solibacter usitatus]
MLECWNALPDHYKNLTLDAFVVMPSHIHGILILDVRAGFKPAHALPEIVRALKTFSARRINAMRATPGQPVWQRNYFERIIRNEKELNETRHYIDDNPAHWDKDPEKGRV